MITVFEQVYTARLRIEDLSDITAAQSNCGVYAYIFCIANSVLMSSVGVFGFSSVKFDSPISK